jgi:hypothetical protein
MPSEKFVVGHTYYSCGWRLQPEGVVGMVFTWIYEGYVHQPGRSSLSCDVPEHFYQFVEMNGWLVKQVHKKARAHSVSIPSAKMADERMLTWAEFINSVREVDEHIMRKER